MIMLLYFLIAVAAIVGVNLLLKPFPGDHLQTSFTIKKIEFIVSCGLEDPDDRNVTVTCRVGKTEGFLGIGLWTPYLGIGWYIVEEVEID